MSAQRHISDEEFEGYKASEDDRWQQHYNNYAELHFNKREGDTLTEEEDAAAIADADSRMKEH